MRIIPVAIIMYTISYVDRTNIAMALPSMSRDLHMDPAQAGNVAGIFFWGYLLLQLPAGYVANRWSAKRLISILLVAWGLCAISCGLVRTWRELWLMRLSLGIAESGVWPAALVLLSRWFPRSERARSNALWMVCLPAAVVFSSPFSGWILDHWNWRIMMIVEGALPLLWLGIWQVFINDRPSDARWISTAELNYLETALTQEAVDLQGSSSDNWLQSLFRREVLLLVLICFLRNITDFGFLIWLPSALEKAKKLTNTNAGVLLALPFIVGIIAMILNSWHSDNSEERRGHMALTFAVGGIFLIMGVLMSGRWPHFAYACVCLTAVGTYGHLGPFWAIPTETLPRNVAGPAIGFVNAVGNLGAFVGSFVVGYLNKNTGGFLYGFGLLGIALLIASALCLFLSPVRPSVGGWGS
jgi:sugar phosphate permease